MFSVFRQTAIAQPAEMTMFYIHSSAVLFTHTVCNHSSSEILNLFSVCNQLLLNEFSFWNPIFDCLIRFIELFHKLFSFTSCFIPHSPHIFLWKWILLKDPSKELFHSFHWLDRGNLKLVYSWPCSQVRGVIFEKFNIIHVDNEGDQLLHPFYNRQLTWNVKKDNNCSRAKQ